MMKIDKWDLRFLQLAKVVSSWSKDPSTKVGSVIVHEDSKRITSLGFNGFPRGIHDFEHLYQNRDKKYERVLHAEQNALLFAPVLDLRDHTIYTYPLPPCNRCALEIIQKGIKRVVSLDVLDLDEYARWKPSFDLMTELFDEAFVALDLIHPSRIDGE